ncbi:MAG: glyoxalase/bleomycin resistance/extradiol dioxygenase family protein [Mycobacterium sp.]|nr:glyoxalase/bleomycin resistance/extradiol dioxygenase family protein [Mycobacterium sp.]
MSTKIFVNLPVRDLQRSVDFFTALGYSFNAQFTDETATSMTVSEDIIVMLLVEARFKDFITKQVCDTSTHAEAILGLSADSRDAVDELVDKALAAGGKPSGEPEDHGVMYGRGFEDLDGHLWSIIWMDPGMIES